MKILLTFLLVLALLLGIPSPALAFSIDISGDPNHEDITTEVLADFEVVVGDETFKFTEKAIEKIVRENTNTDNLSQQFDTKLHFDGEDFLGGSKRVIELKEKTIEFATQEGPNGSAAQTRLGGALHTVQDFYAHSNWVELGHSSSEINTKIGREEFSGADKNTPTCPNDPGILDPNLTELTSGYFEYDFILIPSCKVPEGKCRHGFEPIGCPDGIHKDDKSRPGFDTARALAVNATQDFLEQIFSDSRMEGNVDAIKALMGI